MKEMETSWEKIGKQMPYRVPTDFFAENEAVLMCRIAAAPTSAPAPARGRRMRLPLWVGGAVAAALLAGVLAFWPAPEEPVTANEPLYACHEVMSAEELESWVEFYEADLFVSYE